MRRFALLTRAFQLVVMALPLLISLHSGALAQSPQISSCPKFISAVDGFTLDGIHFGNTPGLIHILFPTSPVVMPGVVTTEIILNPQEATTPSGQMIVDWTDSSIQVNAIDVDHPMGAVDDQTIEITVSILNGKLKSKPCRSYFKGVPKITGGSTDIAPKGMFMLTGWNFGHAGALNVTFPTLSANPLSPQVPNHPHEVNVPVPQTGNPWRRFAIALPLPDVSGVVAQQVDMRFITDQGKGSNVWKPMFHPTLVQTNVPWQYITMVSCGDDGWWNECSADNWKRIVHFCVDIVDTVAGSSLSAFNFTAEHDGCGGIGVTSGTDSYSVNVLNGWTLQYATAAVANAYNGNINLGPENIGTSTPYPNPYTFDVPWLVGHIGGWVVYGGNFVVTGPKGVPYQ
jgi:hypothetical protein